MSFVLNGLFKPIDRAWIAIRRRWARAERGMPTTVSLRAIGPVTIDVACDFTGDTCLRTNLLTKMILDHCAAGSVAEIITDNVASVETIPFMLPGHGCVHLATIRTEAGWNIYVRKENTRK